jgi:S1-C subfamily serine protease
MTREVRGFRRCVEVGCCALLLAFGMTVARAQNPTIVAPSVLRLTATQCVGNSGLLDGRTATAFIWRDKNTAVTALHVVAGCSTINVFYQKLGVQRTAKVSKVYRDGDLALLTINDAAATTPLVETDHPAELFEELQAFGFPLQTPTISTTTLHLRYGGQTLNDLVPASIKSVLAAAKSPSLTLPITNIEGHLVPGLSGAPVVNNQNKVVAIGDGGLENGTVGISWGIPVQALTRLSASTESTTTTSTNPQPRALFAAEMESSNLGEVTCSGITLTKLRTVLFTNIAGSTDDPLGLQQLVNYFQIDPRGFQYDVYQQLSSGATVVVPAGETLQSGANGCTYSSDFAPSIVMRIQIAHANSVAQEMKIAETEELTAGGGSAQNWMADNQFTTKAPVTRFDGLLVRRKAFIHVNPALMGTGVFPQDKYLFETLAARNGFEINTSVLNTDSSVANNRRAVVCRTNPSLEGCAAFNLITAQWVRLVIAVHLATFPIG